MAILPPSGGGDSGSNPDGPIKMAIVSKLNFLKKDKRFKSALDKENQKRFDWFLNFDEFAKKEIENLIKLLKEGKIGQVYTPLQNLEIGFNREALFLGRMRTCARKLGLILEEKEIISAMVSLQKVLKNFREAGRFIGRGKISKVIEELEKIYKLL